MYRVSNKLTWLTGASSGLGRELAMHLSKKGAKLILSGRNIAALEETQGLCHNSDIHRILPFDAGKRRDVDAALASLSETPHILIHNAGVSQRALSYETKEKVVRHITQVNYLTPVHISNTLLPRMIQNGGGLIVIISSIASLAGIPLRSAYSASKAALNIYMATIASEMYAQGIRVSTVYPGFINTNISRNALTKNGNLHATMDESHLQGMESTRAAAFIVNRLGARSIWVGLPFKLKIMRALARHAPGVLAVLLRS